MFKYRLGINFHVMLLENYKKKRFSKNLPVFYENQNYSFSNKKALLHYHPNVLEHKICLILVT